MFYVIGLSNIRGIVINRIVVVIKSQNKAIVCSIARTDDGCFFFGNSTGSSCVKHPRGTDVNAFAEFMVESQINIMAPIIFVWKSLSIVDSTFSKFAVAFGLCIRQTPSCLTPRFFFQKIKYHTTSITQFKISLPTGGITEKTDSVFIFQHIVHVFVIAFY